MSLPTPKPATTPIPGQWSDTECTALILPHLSRPKRGPQCTLGDHYVFNLIVWGLYTGMHWQGLPLPKDPEGQPAIHDPTGYRAFATWAHDGSLEQAFIASVAHLAAETHLDLCSLHGDGTNTVAKKGAMGGATPATNTSRASKSSRSRPTMAMSWLPCRLLPSMSRT
jgi:transposase